MKSRVRVMFKNGHEVLIARELRTIITQHLEVEYFWFARPDGSIIFAAKLSEIEYLIDMNYR
jgi:hypothetical protein